MDDDETAWIEAPQIGQRIESAEISFPQFGQYGIQITLSSNF
jgi:hypothetical protein